MSSLIAIYLDANSLSGSLPTNHTSSMPPRLQIAALAENQLTGEIPSSFASCSELQMLDLGYNNLSGTVPAELGYLRELTLLYLTDNQLIGKVPSSLGNLTKLRELYVSLNKLEGKIPKELGYLQELSVLDLSNNQLRGKIPSSLGNLTKLSDLRISHNKLEGGIPKELGNLSNLQILILVSNGLTGSIPISLLNASMITTLELVNNHLTGTVPATLGESMPMLEMLNIENNSLSGRLDFITSLSNCKNLEYLVLSLNEFEGSLPSSVGNLSVNLQYFYMEANPIDGSIPAGFGNLSNLLGLYLRYNDLMGKIPSALTRLHKLQEMNIWHNKIDGSIPSEIGQMKSLSTLSFEANQLSGVIPNSVSNITGLQHLSLAANTLSSRIPLNLWSLRSLIELNLSRNALHGSIPSDVGNLKVLDTLDLSENQLSGNISTALGNLQMLTYLDLSSNSFYGQIPQSLGGLISIMHLNLSKIFLSGGIPISLANLRYLDSLDLSFNMLEGQIPKGRVFLNITIPSLEGNAALCGAPQLKFQPCHSNIDNPDSRRKLKLLKYILPPIALVGVTLSCVFLIRTIRRKRNVSDLASTDYPPLCEHRIVSYHDLVRATNNFSQANLLGRGSFGSVFKGNLDHGLIVAVKVLNLEVDGSSKSFDAECQVLSRVRHRNLIKIISICSNLDFKALILQFMPNGSLEQCLYSGNYCLNLLQRLNIMVDVSLALEYLHHRHPDAVLHCDLKPSNVLLDEEMVAHVSDFGIAKLLLDNNRYIASASTAGTLGYIAPEYGSTGRVSKLGDVYSFGILLLETFTGKKPTAVIFDEESSLRECICKAFPVALLDIVDDTLLKDGSSTEPQSEGRTAMHQCLSSLIELGLLCSSYSPKERIPMIDVVPKLQSIKVKYLSQLSNA